MTNDRVPSRPAGAHAITEAVDLIWFAISQSGFAGGSGDVGLVFRSSLAVLEGKDQVAAAEVLAQVAWMAAVGYLHLSPADRRDLLGQFRLLPALQAAGLITSEQAT